SLDVPKSGKLVHPADALPRVYPGYDPVTSVGIVRSDTEGRPCSRGSDMCVSVALSNWKPRNVPLPAARTIMLGVQSEWRWYRARHVLRWKFGAPRVQWSV
ncbi:hypothetical protein CORC01_11374, partial [Colletotrichum orchidophilum]